MLDRSSLKSPLYRNAMYLKTVLPSTPVLSGTCKNLAKISASCPQAQSNPSEVTYRLTVLLSVCGVIWRLKQYSSLALQTVPFFHVALSSVSLEIMDWVAYQQPIHGRRSCEESTGELAQLVLLQFGRGSVFQCGRNLILAKLT